MQAEKDQIAGKIKEMIGEKLKNDMAMKLLEKKAEQSTGSAKEHEEALNKLKADHKQKQENIKRDLLA